MLRLGPGSVSHATPRHASPRRARPDRCLSAPHPTHSSFLECQDLMPRRHFIVAPNLVVAIDSLIRSSQASQSLRRREISRGRCRSPIRRFTMPAHDSSSPPPLHDVITFPLPGGAHLWDPSHRARARVPEVRMLRVRFVSSFAVTITIHDPRFTTSEQVRPGVLVVR